MAHQSHEEVILLVIFSGLPGTGKTTLARKVAVKLHAAYLRIDSLEAALLRSGVVRDQRDLGGAGYCAAYALALDNLQNGLAVVADSVNPLKLTRDAWRNVADEAGVSYREIELVCSDLTEHKRRAESRPCDIEGLELPSWGAIMKRAYEPWDRKRLVVDTAVLGESEAVDAILEYTAAGRAKSLTRHA